MSSALDPPPYDKDKEFAEQSVEYLEWCLEQSDERVILYASKVHKYIRLAQEALRYQRASESNVRHMEDLVEQAREREAAQSPQLQEALRQSAAGETVSKGSFTQYVEEDH